MGGSWTDIKEFPVRERAMMRAIVKPIVRPVWPGLIANKLFQMWDFDSMKFEEPIDG